MNSQPETSGQTRGSGMDPYRMQTDASLTVHRYCIGLSRNERTNRLDAISILDQTDIFTRKHSEHLFVMYLSLNSKKHVFLKYALMVITGGFHTVKS